MQTQAFTQTGVLTETIRGNFDPLRIRSNDPQEISAPIRQRNHYDLAEINGDIGIIQNYTGFLIE
jgi:hypothetical protein